MDMHQINLQQRNLQAAARQDLEQHNLQAAPLQNIAERNLQAVPLQDRQERNEYQNGAAGAIEWENNHAQMQPQAVPQPPQAQEAAAMTKQEKRLLKQRQQEEIQRQEEARRRAEEEQRRRREEEIRVLREESLRRYEEERQAKRKLLLEDDVTLKVMEKMVQEKDETLLKERMKLFLRVAAERLLELRPELKEAYRRTVSHVPVAESLKLIAAEHAVNQKQMDLVEKANQRINALETMNYENVVMRVIEFEVSEVFREEYKALAGMKTVSAEIMEEYQKEDKRQIKKLEDLGQEVAEAFHIKSEDGKKVNVLEKGSPFAYLGKKETLEKYHAQVQSVMERRHCTKEEAEKRVLEKRKKELKERALSITLRGSTVENISVEEWKRNGGASFHHTLPAGEALQAVEKSHGYLYAQDKGDGLMELHHTLPETIELTIDGQKKKYPLRRNYNLFIKCIMVQLMDEKGNVYRDDTKIKQMNKMLDALSDLSNGNATDNLQEVIRKSMEFIFETKKDVKTKTAELLDFLKDIVRVSGRKLFFISGEIYGSLETFGQYYQKKDTTLMQQIKQLTAAMKEKGYGQDMIQKYTKAIISFHADADAALQGMLDVRNMDLDSKDVALPNACSENAHFYGTLNQIDGNHMRGIVYETKEHLERFPREHLEYVYANQHKFPVFTDKNYKLEKEKLDTIKQKCSDVNYVITAEDKEEIWKRTNAMCKITYHVAAQVGTMGENMDSGVLTCETFAAESTQAMVSPFIRKSAVGQYKNALEEWGERWYKNQGMTEFYSKYKMLPDVEDVRPEIKKIFLENGIDGVIDYINTRK